MLSPHLRDTERIKLIPYSGESTSPHQVHVYEYMPVHGDAGAIHLLLNKLQSQLTVLSEVQPQKLDSSVRTAAQGGGGGLTSICKHQLTRLQLKVTPVLFIQHRFTAKMLFHSTLHGERVWTALSNLTFLYD